MSFKTSIYANPYYDMGEPPLHQSFSLWANIEISKWAEDNWESNSLAMKGVKIAVSEMTYVALVVVGLIEMVVRGIFALLARPVDLFIPAFCEDWFRNNVYGPLALGTYYAAHAVGLSAVGIVANFFSFATKKDLLDETDKRLADLENATLNFAIFRFVEGPQYGYRPIGV